MVSHAVEVNGLEQEKHSSMEDMGLLECRSKLGHLWVRQLSTQVAERDKGGKPLKIKSEETKSKKD